MTHENTQSKSANFWMDFGPLLVFFVSFQFFKKNNPDSAMLIAAGIFATLAVVVVFIGWLKYKKVSKVLILTTVIIVITASLAIWSGNKVIFFMKPTIINILFAVTLMIGTFLKKNPLKAMLKQTIILPDSMWNKLSLRWGVFFLCMAILNEYIWRTQTESFWASFKVFGVMPITMAFMLTQLPFIMKNGKINQ
jgi:intracellular septation protein